MFSCSIYTRKDTKIKFCGADLHVKTSINSMWRHVKQKSLILLHLHTTEIYILSKFELQFPHTKKRAMPPMQNLWHAEKQSYTNWNSGVDVQRTCLKKRKGNCRKGERQKDCSTKQQYICFYFGFAGCPSHTLQQTQSDIW